MVSEAIKRAPSICDESFEGECERHGPQSDDRLTFNDRRAVTHKRLCKIDR